MQLAMEATATLPVDRSYERSDLQGPSQRLGDYELIEELARGGMGVVYRARQLSLKRMVAVKVLLAAQFANESSRKRFRREAEAAASLNHPNIVSIYEIGEHDGQPFFSMELIEGQDLAALLREKPMPARNAAELLKTIATAVQFAHEKGLLHRDLKPSNVIMDATGVPHVTDFGLAKLAGTEQQITVTGQILGTPSYMPPEQADPKRGATIAASDVYSLGAILYHLLTNRPPFMAETATKTLQLVLEAEPVSVRLLNPGLPRDLETICLKCLEKDPKRRYASAQELADELGRFLNNEPVQARPPSQVYRFQKLVRRNRLAFAAGAAVFAALVIGLGLSTLLFIKERGTRQLAQAEGKKARSEASKSQQVARFLQDMLQSVGPSVAQGRDTTLLQEILDKTAERVGTDFTNQPEVEAELRTTIGLVYEELGGFDKAEDTLRKALSLRRKLPGAELEVAVTLRKLGSVLAGMGKFTEARAALEEALAINRRLPGTDKEQVSCLNEMLNVVYESGTLAESEKTVRQVLELQKKVLGSEHEDVADSLEWLAWLQADDGELPKAEDSEREALAMFRKVLGERHPKVAWSVYHLAGILLYRGKLAEAETVSREAVTKFEALEGKNKSVPPNILNGLAEVFRAENKSQEADALTRANLMKDEQELNESIGNHPRQPGPFATRGFVRGRMGHWSGAAADLSKVAELRTDDYGYYNNMDDHYLVFLAAAFVQTDDLEAYRRLRGNILQRFGKTDSGELATLMAWACLLVPSPEPEDMVAISRLAETGVSRYMGFIALISRQSCKALAEYRQGRFASAADWASKALSQPEYCSDRALRQRAYCRKVDACMVLAMANYHQKQLDEARATLKRGMEIADTKLPKMESGDLGDGWDEWIISQVLSREAKTLIEGGEKAGDESKTSGSSAIRKDPP